MGKDGKQEISFQQPARPGGTNTPTPEKRLFKSPDSLPGLAGAGPRPDSLVTAVPSQYPSGVSLPDWAASAEVPGPSPAAPGALQSWQQFRPLPPAKAAPTGTIQPGQAFDRVPTRELEAFRSPLSPSTPAVRTKKRDWRKKRSAIMLMALSILMVLSLAGFAAWHYVLHPLPSVTLYRVGMQTVNQDIGGGGLVYPVQQLDISYPFESHVLAVFVKPGDKVTDNQSLVQLDLSQTNALDLNQLQVQVAEAKQEMEAALQYLYSVLPTGKEIVIAQAQQQYSAAQARYNALVSEADSPLLHQGSLISPISGTVTAVNVYPGQIIAGNRVMLTIFDESSVIVRVQVPLENYDQVHINQPALITPSALPGASFTGTVMSVIQNVDPQTDTFQVWVKVNNASGSLLPGMSAFVRLQQNTRALVVPRLAVLNPDRDSIVFVERNQHVFIQHVQITGYSGDSIIIGSGLTTNDLIVLVGLDALQDGQKVQVAGVENAGN